MEISSTVQHESNIHWLLDTLQTIDVGLVVIDRNHIIKTWNSFMENHSGIGPDKALEANLFELFPDIPRDWFLRKLDSVFTLKSRAFITWQQRKFLVRFKNYRPITGLGDHMYQDITLIPLSSTTGEIEHVGIIIYDVTDVALNHEQLKNANQQLAILSQTDRLTGLNNRGYWEDCLQKEFKRYKRTRNPCSLVMFDIDHFKQINDTYGHQQGDDVIRDVSRLLQQNIRETDIAGRYGGEEFGVILVNTESEAGLNFTERLRKAVENSEVLCGDQCIRYTISLGIADLDDEVHDYKEWLERADRALYQSKHNGRNRSTRFVHH